MLLANVYIFFNPKISSLDVESVLGIYLDWVQEFELCFLSLMAVVHVQEPFPHVLIIWDISQRSRWHVEHFCELLLFLVWVWGRLADCLIVIKEDFVYCQLHQVIDHSWDQLFKVLCGFSEGRVCIYLDQPHIEVLVYHKVVAEQLEKVGCVSISLLCGVLATFVWIHQLTRREESSGYLLLDLTPKLILLLSLFLRKFLIGVVPKLLQREYVSIFMLAVCFRAFLNCNIGQMDKSVVWVVRVEGELIRTSPEISLLAKVSIAFRIKKAPYPYIELSLIDKKWSLDIFLDNKTIVLVFWLVHLSLRWSNWSAAFGIWGLHLAVKFALASILTLSELGFHASLSLRCLVLHVIL